MSSREPGGDGMAAGFTIVDWPAVKKRLKERFPQLKGRDLSYRPGEEEALVARLERRTGLTPTEIRHLLGGRTLLPLETWRESTERKAGLEGGPGAENLPGAGWAGGDGGPRQAG